MVEPKKKVLLVLMKDCDEEGLALYIRGYGFDVLCLKNELAFGDNDVAGYDFIIFDPHPFVKTEQLDISMRILVDSGAKLVVLDSSIHKYRSMKPYIDKVKYYFEMPCDLRKITDALKAG